MDAGYTFSSQLCINYLAYEDDLCVIGKTEEEIQNMISKVKRFCNWSQVKLNVDKCANPKNTSKLSPHIYRVNQLKK